MLFSFQFFNIVIITLSMWTGFAFAQRDGGFYENRKEGFYWYQDNKPQDETEFFLEPEPDSFSYHDLWRMRPEKFADVLKKRKYLAIQNPTEKNVYSYLEAQDVAKRKSMAFSGVMGLVAQTNPKFSRVHGAALTGPGKRAYYNYKTAEMHEVLNAGADDFALLVFESPGCHYCKEQRPIIDRFQVSYNWTVKYLDIEEYRFLAEEYGIEITPSIIMLSKSTNEAIPISSGVVTLVELSKRIMRAIRYITGETKPEQWFNETGVSDPLKFIDQKDKFGK